VIRLRPFRLEDEDRARTAHAELKELDHFPFLLGYTEGDRWTDFLSHWEAMRRGERVPERSVPATLLAATVEGELVGRVSVRHELNDWLAAYGGHIGYAVVPSQRRRGYAIKMLRQALVVARSMGIDEALLMCDENNIASARVIERCGGELDSVVVAQDGSRLRRYWIR
jgi:predicted acetyltransferase